MAAGTLGVLINRKALADSPREIFNSYIFFVSAILSFAGGFHGANTSNISGIIAMKDFVTTFHLSSLSASAKSNVSGWITSVIVLGGLGGALTSAPFNDRLGRRWTMFINSIIYLVGCIVQLTADGSVNRVIGGRAMQGFASGTGSVTGTLYLAEIAPSAIRGVLGAFFGTNIMLGVALGYWVNYICILHIKATSHWQWRVPVIFQMYPGIVLLFALPFAVESPRWLVLRGQPLKARATLSRLRRLPENHPYLVEEFDNIVRSVAAEQEVASSSSWSGLYREVVHDRTLLRRLILVVIIQLGFNFSGGNSITYYQTSILTSIGVTTTDGAYLFSGVYGLMKVVSVLVYAFFLSERFGRRRMLLIGSGINILCVSWIAIYLGKFAGHNHAAGWVAVAAVCVFAIGYGIGWAPIAFGVVAEVFPNQVRAKIMSLCFGVQYLANFCLTRFFPNMVANIGPYGPFAIFAVVSATIWIYALFALPETKGLPIENMNTIFGQHWYVNGIKTRKSEQSDLETVADGNKELDDGEMHKEQTDLVENPTS